MDYNHLLSWLPPTIFSLQNGQIKVLSSPHPSLLYKYLNGLLDPSEKKIIHPDVVIKNVDINIAINGGGLRVVYFSLLGAYLKRKTNLRINKISGISSGSIFAAIIKTPGSEYQFTELLSTIERIRQGLIPSLYYDNCNNISHIIEGNLMDTFMESLRTLINEDNLKDIILKSYKLSFLGPKEVIHTNFKNYEEYRSVCNATACIPFITNKNIAHKHNNEYHVDGGIPFHENNWPYIYFDNSYPVLVLNQNKVKMSNRKAMRFYTNTHRYINKGILHFFIFTNFHSFKLPFFWIYNTKDRRTTYKILKDKIVGIYTRFVFVLLYIYLYFRR